MRKLLVTGLTLLAVGMLWLARVPADASYVTDLLPAFLLAGVAIGLCAPSVQIGALSGVTESTSGLASGLVETMREIGGAAGVAAVSTVLVSRAGLDGFRAAFVVISRRRRPRGADRRDRVPQSRSNCGRGRPRHGGRIARRRAGAHRRRVGRFGSGIMNDLAGRTTVVVGASRGLGRGIAAASPRPAPR